MTPDDLRAMINYLRDRVTLDKTDEAAITVVFDLPSKEAMVRDGLHSDGISRLLEFPWVEDMITDIIETPDFCEEDDTPEQILEYAKDVVSDYMRKRFPLEP